MKRFQLLLVWILCVFVTPVLLCMMLLQTLFGNTERAYRMALSLDECGNSLFGGLAGMTISCRTGNGVILGYRWAVLLAPFIDLIFGAGHCIGSAKIPNPDNVQVNMSYVMVPIGILKYLIYASCSLIVTVFAIVFVNWWVVLLADSKGNLPWWCSYFQTFDTPLPTGYIPSVLWLMRNPSYGFDFYLFGIPWRPGEWKCRVFHSDHISEFFIATSSTGGFNFYYLGPAGMYKFGWKAWNCFNPDSGKFSAVFGDGSHVPICISFNPFKYKA